MIGVTAAALAAAVALAAAAALFVWAAAFALYSALAPTMGSAAAAGIVAAVDGAVILVGFGIVRLISALKEKKQEAVQEEEPPSMVGLFMDAFKDRPLVTLLVSAATGFAAVRNPQIFKDLVADVLRRRK